jgi:hypothetical protein
MTLHSLNTIYEPQVPSRKYESPSTCSSKGGF